MRDLACRVLRLMGDPIAPEFGALPDRPAEIPRMYCDASRARELLGWAPRTPLDDGLARTIDWYRAELQLGASVFAL
jgi:nucleoside-diphosphate-sugar epimerase